MKFVPFFLLSVAFHAAVLAFPVPFLRPDREPMIPVTLLAVGEDDGQASAGKRLAGGKGKSSAGTSTRQDGAASAPESHGDRTEGPAQALPQNALSPEPSEDSQTAMAVWGGEGGGEEMRASYGAGHSGDGKQRSGAPDGSAMATGSGKRGGDGGSGGGMVVQASYTYNPKPEYPERARREGWEGIVLLRVLVDQEGKSKWVEVSRSSGFETLDQAAVKTVKGWRFYPARSGAKVLESWVGIPIVFRLDDLKN